MLTFPALGQARNAPLIRLFARAPLNGRLRVAPSLLHHNGPPLTDLRPVMIDPRQLAALGEETRGHPPTQIRKICRSLRAFGFVCPVLVDDNNRVIGGWALVLAARELRLSEVPVVTITGLSEARARMLRLALNRLAEDSHWDRGALRREFTEILQIEADIFLPSIQPSSRNFRK